MIVLTDKQTAEALFTQKQYDQKKTRIRRGNLVTDPKLLKKLTSADRYDPSAKDGISQRWLPGAQAATYCAQGDEHDTAGSVNETAVNATAQMEKRMRKMEALKRVLPEPSLMTMENGKWKMVNGFSNLDLLIVSWGSNKGVILDVINTPTPGPSPVRGRGEAPTIGYLHYTYLWPMKTERLEKLMKKAKRTVLVECNAQGQLGMTIKMASGIDLTEKILKYDGRPFFYDELLQKLLSCLAV